MVQGQSPRAQRAVRWQAELKNRLKNWMEQLKSYLSHKLSQVPMKHQGAGNMSEDSWFLQLFRDSHHKLTLSCAGEDPLHER